MSVLDVEPLAPFGAVIRGLEMSGSLDAAAASSVKSYASMALVLDHSWIEGDIVLWDELGHIHCRRPFDESGPRLMRTINVLVDDAEAPFAFTGRSAGMHRLTAVCK